MTCVYSVDLTCWTNILSIEVLQRTTTARVSKFCPKIMTHFAFEKSENLIQTHPKSTPTLKYVSPEFPNFVQALYGIFDF